jgi:hypothetical protein
MGGKSFLEWKMVPDTIFSPIDKRRSSVSSAPLSSTASGGIAETSSILAASIG